MQLPLQLECWQGRNLILLGYLYAGVGKLTANFQFQPCKLFLRGYSRTTKPCEDIISSPTAKVAFMLVL